jgi:hypothetical protein
MTKTAITTNIQAKRPISNKEKQELLAKIVESDKIITDLTIETHECTVDYANNITKFTDIHTGEIVEEHPTTPEEQLRLNDKWVDAETVIREDAESE